MAVGLEDVTALQQPVSSLYLLPVFCLSQISSN